MSAAPAAAPAEGEVPKKSRKKLIIIIATVVLLLVVGGGGALFIMKKKAAEAEAAAIAEDEDSGDGDHAKLSKEAKNPEQGKREHGKPPAFVPLDPFVVNLADRESERFAQVGITLQVDDPHMADEMKAYMPAIRNAVLLLLSHKSSEELLTPEGKTRLAQEIRRDTARAMGYVIEDLEEELPVDKPPNKKKKKKKAESYNPIVQVHYANFIIQ